MPPRPSNALENFTLQQTTPGRLPIVTEAEPGVTTIPHSFGATEEARIDTASYSRGRRVLSATPLQPTLISTATQTPIFGSHSSTKPIVSTAPYKDPLPDLPAWLVCMMAGMLAFGFVAAITLWLVQFYPRHSRLRVRAKHSYHQVQNDDYEMHCYSTGTPNRQGPALFTCRAGRCEVPAAADSPAKGSAVRRRKPKNLSIDTNVGFAGLGIAVPGQQNQQQPSAVLAKCEHSSDASSLNDSSWMRTTQKHRTSAPPSTRNQIPDLPKLEHTKKTLREFRYRRPDIRVSSMERDEDTISLLSRHSSSSDEDIMESGLLLPSSKPLDKPSKYSPSSSPSSSRSPSRVRVVLDRVEDGIEWATERAVRMFHDQLVKEDREEGSLLPVRAEERLYQRS